MAGNPPRTRAFAAVTRAVVELLGHEQARAQRESQRIRVVLDAEAPAGVADLRAAKLQIDRGAGPHRPQDVQGAERLGIDEILVAEDAARYELELTASD